MYNYLKGFAPMIENNTNSNNNKFIKPMAIGTGAGAVIGAGYTQLCKSGSKKMLKFLKLDSFEKVQDIIRNDNIKGYGGLLATGDTIEFSKKELSTLANAAYKTTWKTFAKSAAIVAGAGALIGGAIALIKGNNSKTQEK